MPKDRQPSYTPAPELPADPVLRKRFETIVAVLAGTMTVTAAAESLNLARNHFQTVFHRVLASMLETLTPKPAGRPAKPAREAELEAENARLRAELEAVTSRAKLIEGMMGVVGDIASGRTPMPRKLTRAMKKKSEGP
jgi:hypothetical protein